MSAQPQIDQSVPHQARVWNYFLGGKDYYAADREFAESIIAAYPAMRDVAVGTRGFLTRAVRHLAADLGVRQFLDVGTGLPTAGNTHEIAQAIAPESKIVYVDNDPLVLMHAKALLRSSPEGVCRYLDADARDPQGILDAAAETLDLSRPVALSMLGVLGTVWDDARAHAIIDTFVAALAPGSYVALEDGTNTVNAEAASDAEKVRDEEGGYEYRLRTPAQIRGFFKDLDLLPPGVVSVTRWRPAPTPTGALPAEVDAYCGLARKP
ncbi:O-methyltransferase involved in polyketide biosynthesis [Actinocorallia herbida]|uniref:O-methyltransferase involved in polyketide biosynthesis n=1 Tax=Actinocorallia herbida TaxID=58109 RepID=A0A3N1CWB7_9ACTN|nr:SAM-dependent methyltransferase [Actinocorallia herbida]ROO85008.1 O-methyltransferase involved in polyketide biosynthesis [Actinocorallia herbida]